MSDSDRTVTSFVPVRRTTYIKFAVSVMDNNESEMEIGRKMERLFDRYYGKNGPPMPHLKVSQAVEILSKYDPGWESK